MSKKITVIITFMCIGTLLYANDFSSGGLYTRLAIMEHNGTIAHDNFILVHENKKLDLQLQTEMESANKRVRRGKITVIVGSSITAVGLVLNIVGAVLISSALSSLPTSNISSDEISKASEGVFAGIAVGALGTLFLGPGAATAVIGGTIWGLSSADVRLLKRIEDANNAGKENVTTRKETTQDTPQEEATQETEQDTPKEEATQETEQDTPKEEATQETEQDTPKEETTQKTEQNTPEEETTQKTEQATPKEESANIESSE